MTTHANAGETLAAEIEAVREVLNRPGSTFFFRKTISDELAQKLLANIDTILAALRAQSAQPAEITDDRIYAALKCVRGCATDDQFQELRSNVERLLLAAQPAQADAMRRIVEEIAAERERQKSIEGYTLEHDDRHNEGEIAMGALAYAAPDWFFEWLAKNNIRLWQWDEPIKRTGGIRDLIKAAAMIVAEIERQRRALASAPGEKGE